MKANNGINAGDAALFVGATHGRYGSKYPLRTYDDGSGPLWIYRESLGVLGIVRADTWEAAWSCVEDEIMDDADPSDVQEHEEEQMTKLRAKYPGQTDEEIMAHDAPDLPEGCGFRDNGNGSHAWNKTGIYRQDLNGNSLDLMTAQDMEDNGIIVTWEEWK